MDTELVLKAQTGDMVAFTELVRRHDRAVLALVARYVDNAEDAKDIYQDVMIKVYRALPGFKFRSEFSTWVHRIAVNSCLTHRRRPWVAARAAHAQQERDAEGAPARERQADGPSPADAAVDADTAAHVQQALGTLSPKQRMVFSLRHFEGRSLREIADTMRCTEGTVKRYLFTGTRRMREQLRDLL